MCGLTAPCHPAFISVISVPCYQKHFSAENHKMGFNFPSLKDSLQWEFIYFPPPPSFSWTVNHGLMLGSQAAIKMHPARPSVRPWVEQREREMVLLPRFMEIRLVHPFCCCIHYDDAAETKVAAERWVSVWHQFAKCSKAEYTLPKVPRISILNLYT